MEIIKDDYIKNHLKDYTYIVKVKDTIQPIWSIDLSFENAKNTFELMKEKQKTNYTLIAILEGDYSSIPQEDTRVIIPSKYYYKKNKKTKDYKLDYYKRLCKYLNIEY